MYIIFRTHARLQQQRHKQRLLLPILNPIHPAESNVDSLNQYHTLHYTKPASFNPGAVLPFLLPLWFREEAGHQTDSGDGRL